MPRSSRKIKSNGRSASEVFVLSTQGEVTEAADRESGTEGESDQLSPPSAVTLSVPEISARLQTSQREREVVLKSRIKQENRIIAVMAGCLGYVSTMPEKARKEKYEEASKVIEEILAGRGDEQRMASVVLATYQGINAFDGLIKDLQKKMEKLAAQLPVAEWVGKPEQRGFGLFHLAAVVGECGDLNNYSNPGKVWRRLGCQPWTFNGKTMTGRHWRMGTHGKLPAEEWTKYGYSPRRRSICFRIADGLIKQNGKDSETAAARKKGLGQVVRKKDGLYRLRYDESKEAYKLKHSDCSDQSAHWHGMLLSIKLLLKNLWREWTGKGTEWKGD